MPVPQDGPLDPAVLKELLDLDDGALGLVAEMTQLFREDMPLRLEALRAALGAGDATAAGEVAHAMKGASGAIGARALQPLAAEMERACRQGQLEGKADLAARIETAYGEAIGALEAFLAGQS